MWISLRLPIVVLLLSPATVLRAQDFFGQGITARTAARAGIYVPSSDGALDALSANPAGLTSLTASVVNLSAIGLLARGSFSNAVNHESPMRFTGGALPFAALGVPVSKRWTFGIGILPDLASAAKWQFQDAPGVGGADYGAQNQTSKIMAFRSTGGVAYRISAKLSIGATVSALYNSNTLIMPYVFQSHPVLSGLKTELHLHTAGFGWNTSFGAIVRPTRNWEFGAMYRTRSLITSTGTATGNIGVQLAALQIPFQPNFAYRAQVRVELPQSAVLNASWQQSSVLRLSAQANWTNWNRSFAFLPVSLTKGNNADINGFLRSNGIEDRIPLQWKDQISLRVAAERSLGENLSLAAGFVHQNSPVPSSTLSPLTAAIMANGLSAGFGWNWGHTRFDAAYQVNLTAEQRVQSSSLLSGEFSHSQVRVGTQGLTLSTSFRLHSPKKT